MVYKHKFDWALKMARTNAWKVDQMMETEGLREVWEVIKNQSDKSLPRLSTADPAPAPVLQAGEDDIIALSADFGLEQLCGLTTAQLEMLTAATELAKRIVAAGCQLVDGTDREVSLVTALQESTISKIQGGIDGYVVIIYDLKASGEDLVDPVQRAAPLDKIEIDKVTRVALKARSDVENSINPGDVYVLFDDGRPGTFKQLQGSLKACRKVKKKTMHIIYVEDSLLKRRQSLSSIGQSRSRGFMTMRQLEGAHFISAKVCSNLQRRPKLYYPGTSCGNALTSVAVPDIMNDGWLMTAAEKTVLLGESKKVQDVTKPICEVDVDDKSDSDQDVAKVGKKVQKKLEKRFQQNVDSDPSVSANIPFNFSQMTPELYEEVLHRAGAKGVIDLTASDGVLTLVCLEKTMPYFGICHNALHAAALTRRLESRVFASFSDATSNFYDPAVAVLMSQDNAKPAPRRKEGPSRGRTAKSIKRASGTTTDATKPAKKPKIDTGDVVDEGGDVGSDLDEGGDLGCPIP